MSVRKASGFIELSHLVGSNWQPSWTPNKGGLVHWLATGSWNPNPRPSGPPSGPIRISLGNSTYETNRNYSEAEFRELRKDTANAIILGNIVGRGQLVRFRSDWYWADSDLSEEEIDAVLKARNIRKKQSVERAKSLAALQDVPSQSRSRAQIPQDLKLLVWTRDGGSCTRCGSRTELQYDHIIPVALGGATTEQNLQILCGACNRTKGASVG